MWLSNWHSEIKSFGILNLLELKVHFRITKIIYSIETGNKKRGQTIPYRQFHTILFTYQYSNARLSTFGAAYSKFRSAVKMKFLLKSSFLNFPKLGITDSESDLSKLLIYRPLLRFSAYLWCYYCIWQWHLHAARDLRVLRGHCN